MRPAVMDHSWRPVVALVLIAYITIMKAESTERHPKGLYLPPPDPYGPPYPEYHRDHKHHYNTPENMPSPQPMTATKSNVTITTIAPEMGDEDVPNYPYEEIRKILENSPSLKQYFEKRVEIENRQGLPDDLERAESLCRARTQTKLYKKMKNINGKEVLLVNDDRNYTQAIKYHECVSTGACSVSLHTYGYENTCVQQYSNMRLLIYQNSTKQILFDQFRVPSCCTCKIIRV